VASRRRAESLIERGRVQVNDQIVTELGTKIDPEIDEVRVKGRLIKPIERGVIILNKPPAVITSMDDPEGRPTVADFLSARYRSYYPVGRLDWESTGLVIMTNDGEMAQKLLHPKYQVDRTYEVLVEGSMPYEVASRIDRGVNLEEGIAKGHAKVMDRPSERSFPATWVRVTLSIGWNRVIRRIFDKLGFPVVELHRVKHGPFKLGQLKPGEVRKLSEKEYQDARATLFPERSKRWGALQRKPKERKGHSLKEKQSGTPRRRRWEE